MNLLDFPAADYALSPFTGWTRSHHAAVADRMLLGARAWASPGHARIVPPGPVGGYGTDVDGLEGFARTFLAAGFRLAGEGGKDPHNLAEWYADGIAAGTDPRSPERWVRPDEDGQAKVEAAALAVILDLTRPWIWDRLSTRVQEQVVDYFSPVIHAEYPPTNWVWFRLVVEQFLRSVGGPYSREDMEADLALHDSLIRPDGWYSDGPERSFDHYTGWALHLYPVLWQQMAGDKSLAAARGTKDIDHLNAFLPTAVRLVGANGSPLISGRSLIYRFAAAAPFWVGALAGCTSVAPGVLRRAASGIVAHFHQHNAPGPDGLLTMGWHHEWPAMAQSYSGPGSPYWASKGLLGLALPPEHEIWTAVEEPLPVEEADFSFAASAPNWIICGTRSDGVVRVINHGTDHAVQGAAVTDSPLYARLAYSTATAPVIAGGGGTDPFDSSVTLGDRNGRPSHRAGFEPVSVSVRTQETDPAGVPVLAAASRWRAHWVSPEPGARDYGGGRSGTVRYGAPLTVVSVVCGTWEVRLARMDRDPAADEEPAGILTLGGWPVAGEAGQTSVVVPLLGLEQVGRKSFSDATPLARGITTVPWAATTGPARAGAWHAAAVALGGSGNTPTLTLDQDESGAITAVIGWPGGGVTSLGLPGAGSSGP